MYNFAFLFVESLPTFAKCLQCDIVSFLDILVLRLSVVIVMKLSMFADASRTQFQPTVFYHFPSSTSNAVVRDEFIGVDLALELVSHGHDYYLIIRRIS